MAIAGGAVPAVRITALHDGTLRVEPSVMVQREIALDVDDALDTLLAGEGQVYLRLYGENLLALQRNWQTRIGN